jgi:hypothetical protein
MSELETYVETAEFALLGTNSPENQIINEVEVGEQATFILVYGMDEAAGNEFKTTKFEARISLQAKQYTYEADDFNNKYDKKATYAPQTKAEFEAIYGEGNVVVISEEVATGLSAEEEAKAIASKFESLVGATQAADSESVAPQVILVDREIDFLTLGEAGKQDVDEDTGKIIIARDVIIEGINSDAVITGRPLKIAENVKNVTIKNITFTKPGVNPQNDNCFIQGYYFKGKLSIEGCTFTDPQHESIRLMGNLEGLDVSIINNTFNASKTVVGSYGQVFRQIHIENNFFKDGHRVGREGYKACEVCPDEVTNVTVRLVGNTFNDVNNILHQSIGLINVNLDQVTVGRNTFTGIKEADSTTEGYAKNLYLCYTGNEQANKDLIHGVRSPLGLENLQSPTLCNILQPRDNSTSSETQE